MTSVFDDLEGFVEVDKQVIVETRVTQPALKLSIDPFCIDAPSARLAARPM
jgi:hypothetical protein